MKKLLMILAMVVGVLLGETGSIVHANETHHHTNPAPHAAFYSPTSGWYQARVNKQSLWIANVPGNFPDINAYGPWNTAAGWQLIRPTSTLSGWISFQADMPENHPRVAGVEILSVENGDWYYSCIIHYKWSAIVSGEIDADLFAHEIGHCLGFGDHITMGINNTTGCTGDPPQCTSWAQPQCSQPTKPYYSAYVGVMSYCDWAYRSRWFGPHDVYSLALYGYDGP